MRGIAVVFQLEEGEILGEPLPARDNRRAVLAYEAAEGGAGVLGLLPMPKPIMIGGERYHVVLVPSAPVPVGGALIYVPAAWVKPGAHITCVTRRELDKAIVGRADVVAQLGIASIPPEFKIPHMDWPSSSIGRAVLRSKVTRIFCCRPSQRAIWRIVFVP